jgi:hypothetical protein
MKVFVSDNISDFIESKPDGRGNVDLSIRTYADSKKIVAITAKLDADRLDKLIANLILLKSKILSEKNE